MPNKKKSCCKSKKYGAHGSGTDLLLIFLLLAAQIVFWYGIPGSSEEKTIWRGTRTIKPNLGVVPDLHTDKMASVVSLGDDQFYFRTMGLRIQNAGDSFGRVTPLKDYDYSKLYKWWSLLDRMDKVSNFVPSMVAYYYGATQNTEDHIPFVADYLEQHADHDPSKKWWWYTQAVYHAKHKLNDMERSLRIAQKLRDVPPEIKMPVWARQMKAFILEDMGEYAEACQIIIDVMDNYDDLTEGEINFMMHFIEERVRAMKDYKGLDKLDPRCQKAVAWQAEQDEKVMQGGS